MAAIATLVTFFEVFIVYSRFSRLLLLLLPKTQLRDGWVTQKEFPQLARFPFLEIETNILGENHVC
jgi:hypothetical protein